MHFITEPVDSAVLHEAEVVLGEGGDEDDGAHVLKAVDPLAALRSLAPDIHQPEVNLAKLKNSLLDIRTFIILILVFSLTKLSPKQSLKSLKVKAKFRTWTLTLTELSLRH